MNATVVVTQPASGATVPIPTTAPLTIQYQPAPLPDTTISALASDAREHFTFTLPQTESGAIAMAADNFSSFQGGPGTLTITRETVAYPARDSARWTRTSRISRRRRSLGVSRGTNRGEHGTHRDSREFTAKDAKDAEADAEGYTTEITESREGREELGEERCLF